MGEMPSLPERETEESSSELRREKNLRDAERDRDTGRHREKWSLKKGQGKVERDGERVSEPEKRTKGGETFGETPRRCKEGEREAEMLREASERDSRGGGRKRTPRVGAGVGQTQHWIVSSGEQEGGGR